MADLDINFGFTSSAQSLGTAPRELQARTNAFARLIVNEVGLSASEDAYKYARATLVRSVQQTVMAEVSRMAMLIGSNLSLPAKYSGPSGSMSIKEGASATFESAGFRPTFDRQTTGIRWAKRSPKYLRWKQRHGYGANWWDMSGQLMRTLSDPQIYLDAFGPIAVRFTRARNQTQAKKGLSASQANSGLSASVTVSGRSGRIVSDFQVGRLEVVAFGNITPAMLPALGRRSMDPKFAEPASGDGLATLIHDQDARAKLLRRPKGAKARFALEPFVSFYLTRAIPNAVWRRTERLIQQGASS